MSQPDADRRAATAVIAHHTQLAADLARHTAALRDAARQGTPALWPQRRAGLLGWLRTELLPHAAAEETALYPAAAAQASGRLLVEAMVGEHQTITALVAELETADTATDAAAAARALTALFEVHLDKENNLVLPLLLDTAHVSLAGLLTGMHDLLGCTDAPDAPDTADEVGGSGAGGCGCGGGGCGCGCGGDRGPAGAPAPVLSVDTRLDVRALPHDERHARVLAAVDALPADGALVLIAPHTPRPLLAEIDARHPGQIDTDWLQDGPDVWQLRLHRHPVNG
ncbi:DUF2249 domain-containing protein [Dactylosporangium sp. NPDC005572]|uniref:DUF2249 domain-containing protein n=1 Tax=Dactylosporangium sp. NPDC005572 TaxID=3156889 RepID=UPI0033B5E07F